MLVGIVGAPNKGKSTLFSALTMMDVQIADYPFTTIKPNAGTAYVTRECAEREIGAKCSPRNSACTSGTRMIPVEVVDVAGLVEGAHAGRGMGNQFLNDISSADALILVVDASGRTDKEGNPCNDCDPADDVAMVTGELREWLSGIIKRHAVEMSRSKDGAEALRTALTGLRIGGDAIERSLSECGLTPSSRGWTGADMERFSAALLEHAKPMLIAANKSDVNGSGPKVEKLKSKFGDGSVIPCSAVVELALRRAERQGMIEYKGRDSIHIIRRDITGEQESALKYMISFAKERGTGVQDMINRIYFEMLGNIVVYPVEDENRWTDHFGNVLPDAVLLKKGSTAADLAAHIHTDLAKGMLYAIDGRTKMRLGRDHVLKDNDVIRIVSAAKPK